MGFITKEGLKALDEYKYVSGTYSWLDNRLNGFWLWSANRLPETMAPNTVTFIGFLAVISSYLVMLFYDRTLQAEIPRWIFIKAGFDVLFYQTFDAMDGKQARRTKSSSPLGQLFDHGCDSFSLTFFLLISAQACLLDANILFFLFVGTQAVLFLSNWIEYHTHVLNTQMYNFGVTEAEFIVAGVQFVAGIFGQQFWAHKNWEYLPVGVVEALRALKLPVIDWFLEVRLSYNIAYFVLAMQVIIFVAGVVQTLRSLKTSRKEAILQFTPIVQCVIIEYFWFRSSIYTEYAGMILVNFGLLVSLITIKLIISSLTRMRLKKFHYQILPLAAATAILEIFGSQMSNDAKEWVFVAFAVVNLIVALYFINGVVQQITDYLGIYCFSIEKRKPRKDI